MMRNLLFLAVVACLTACGSFQAYEGEKRDRAAVATIVGDYRIRAGAPLSLYLRSVDDHEVPMTDHSAQVLPGEHTLLIDCIIAETHAISRHTLKVDLLAGYRYRLIAQTEPGMRACERIEVEADR